MPLYKRLSFFVLPILLVLAACGGGNTHGDQDTDVQEEDVPVTPPGIDTVVSTTAIKAGGEVEVQCVGNGFNPNTVQLIIRPQDDPQPEGELPDPALPEGVAIKSQKQGKFTVEFTKTDRFLVACYSAESMMLDDTPARIIVSPANAVSIETEVDPKEITAGERVTVICTAVDRYGNVFSSGMHPYVVPSQGVHPSGLSVQLTVVGSYDIACALTDTDVVDRTPEKVTVSPGMAKKILTRLSPAEIEAGGKTTLSCEPLDFYDNPVPLKDCPVSVAPLSPVLTMNGMNITTTAAGVYPIKCIPSAIDWSYFQLIPANLIVNPGPPKTLVLEPSPKKPFYGTNEVLRVDAHALDQYGNMIPDLELSPVDISPNTGGIVPVDTDPTGMFLMQEEGVYHLTFRLAQFPTVYNVLEVIVEGSGPLLSILYPERGATLKSDKPTVTVSYIIADDETGIKSLKWAIGFDTSPESWHGLPPGRTNVPVTVTLGPLSQGLNIVRMEVENNAGLKTEARVGIYFSSDYYENHKNNPALGIVKEGVRAFLGRNLIDDQDHSLPPNDVATIIELLLTSLDIGALLPNPVAESGPYRVELSNLSYGKPTVNVWLNEGGMVVRIAIPNFKVKVSAIGECNFIIDWCPDVSGWVSSSNIYAVTDVLIWMDENGKIHAKSQEVKVNLYGLKVDIDGILGDLLGWLIDILVKTFTKTIEEAIEQQIVDLIDKTLTDLLGKFEIHETFEIPAILSSPPTALSLYTKPGMLDVQPEGIWLDMGGTIYSKKGVNRNPLGSIARANCLNPKPQFFEMPRNRDIGLAAHDDILNQALFALWWTGTLNFTLNEETLAGVDMSKVPVRDLDVKLNFLLPPMLTDCGAEGKVRLQIGDLFAEGTMIFLGNNLELTLFLQAEVDANLTLVEGEEGPEVALSIDGTPLLDIELLTVNEDFPIPKEDLIELLEGDLISTLLKDLAGKELFSFAIPKVDLSSLANEIPKETELDIVFTNLYREGGFTVAQGYLR
ncbi:hypothetical protein KBB45_07065 [Myxococcota bacterium]|nr:hypothetical protein [Myxococcota bacterium]